MCHTIVYFFNYLPDKEKKPTETTFNKKNLRNFKIYVEKKRGKNT